MKSSLYFFIIALLPVFFAHSFSRAQVITIKNLHCLEVSINIYYGNNYEVLLSKNIPAEGEVSVEISEDRKKNNLKQGEKFFLKVDGMRGFYSDTVIIDPRTVNIDLLKPAGTCAGLVVQYA